MSPFGIFHPLTFSYGTMLCFVSISLVLLHVPLWSSLTLSLSWCEVSH